MFYLLRSEYITADYDDEELPYPAYLRIPLEMIHNMTTMVPYIQGNLTELIQIQVGPMLHSAYVVNNRPT